MRFGRSLAPDAAILALSLCFQNDPLLRRSDVYRSCICRGLRKPVLYGPSPSKSLKGLALSPVGSVTFRRSEDALQKDWTEGNAGAFYTQASPREPAAGVSVKRPLQRPLEQAITVGNWREAVVLIEKLLLVGSLPDNLASDHVLKGGWCTRGAGVSGPQVTALTALINLVQAISSVFSYHGALCRSVCKGCLSHGMEAVHLTARAVQTVPVFNLPDFDHQCFPGELSSFLYQCLLSSSARFLFSVRHDET